jgi:hypothetical protein
MVDGDTGVVEGDLGVIEGDGGSSTGTCPPYDRDPSAPE